LLKSLQLSGARLYTLVLIKLREVLMGKWTDKLSGKSKQRAGQMTGDQSMQAEGKVEEGKGRVKDALD
jgi:uncharacterized protein YjbJ (UPF0337 family)